MKEKKPYLRLVSTNENPRPISEQGASSTTEIPFTLDPTPLLDFSRLGTPPLPVPEDPKQAKAPLKLMEGITKEPKK